MAFWDTHEHRLVDAIGGNVRKWELDPVAAGLQDQAATGTDPNGAVTTVVEAGAGTSEMSASKTAGYLAELVTAANDNDGISVQFADENFELTSDQDLYFGIELECDEATQSDLLVGLCITDTALLGGMTDGVYHQKLDGGTGVSTVTEKASTETQSDNEGTFADDTLMYFEFYWDGTSVYFYINGVEVGIVTTNIPTEALRPSIEFLSGEAVAHTIKIRKFKVIQIGL
jgi:hypothetical protein